MPTGSPGRAVASALAIVASAALCLLGCVQPFAGSWLSLSLTWPQPTLLPEGDHLEIWAALDTGALIRLTTVDPSEAFHGFDVRPALSPNEPCLIRALNPDDPCRRSEDRSCTPRSTGAHLLSADAQESDSASERLLLQQAVVQHARQVVSKATAFTVAGGVLGKAPTPLLALVENDPGGKAGVPGVVLSADNAGTGVEAERRQAACLAFIGDPKDPERAPHPNYYLGNPRQLTKPLHGHLFGFFNFCTTPEWPAGMPLPTTCAVVPELPPQNYGSITLSTPLSLRGLAGLLVTRESTDSPRAPSQDPTRQLIRGVPLPASAGGRGVTRLALVATVPTGMGTTQTVTIGTASVLTGLDEALE